MDKQLITLGAKIELARRRFFFYAQLKNPDFYRSDRKYLQELCDTLQWFLTSDKKILVLNMPPRHGKSYTASNFVEWALGRDNTLQVMIGSYNETLSTRFSKNVRDSISEAKADIYRPVYSDVFPATKIKRGDGAMNLWSLEGQQTSYLATSPTGTATGFGCRLMIIDDLIKNAEEAYNENVKEKHWDWFTNTMLSRGEGNYKIIVIMTRWASDDLAGKVLEYYPAEKIVHINMKAVQDDGSMLCDGVLDAESCMEKKQLMGLDIWSANYQQEPIDIKGRLYSGFKTYDGELPLFKRIASYTDTADTGSDYLASYCYGVTFSDDAYILDVVYTQKAMEYTEPAVADMLYKNRVKVADIESNNGGRGFARNVERLLKAKGDSVTKVRWFTQHRNKQARILSNATWCMEHIYFPKGWHNKWSELYKSLTTYQKEGKNIHDDAEDALTGICESITERIKTTPTRVDF